MKRKLADLKNKLRSKTNRKKWLNLATTELTNNQITKKGRKSEVTMMNVEEKKIEVKWIGDIQAKAKITVVIEVRTSRCRIEEISKDRTKEKCLENCKNWVCKKYYITSRKKT